MKRLEAVAGRRGGFAVLYGRRRLGKSRLLLEWVRKRDGLYSVADQSSPEVQRRYFADLVAQRLPGFADVEYPDWRTLLTRLANDARIAGWRGPIIFDEFPYLAAAAPELPSVLQRWVDVDAKEAGLCVALAGSSQRMMQGLVLSRDAPLYGRSHELLEILPLDSCYLKDAFSGFGPRELVESYTAWGGVPRYWELAADTGGSARDEIDRLVLDPLGPLHTEPDRLLAEELPPAIELRPILDAIGMGAHRVSEIAGRIGQKATSLSRPLDRLVGLGLVRREVSFGESPKKSRRAVYKIDDPFVRLWFRVVAPNRGALAAASRAARLRLLDKAWSGLLGAGWEELCRNRVSKLNPATPLAKLGPWGPASRWWRGGAPEWDVVSESLEGGRVLLGEARWASAPWTRRQLERGAERLSKRDEPELPAKFDKSQKVRVLFIPEVEGGRTHRFGDVVVVTCSQLLRKAGSA